MCECVCVSIKDLKSGGCFEKACLRNTACASLDYLTETIKKTIKVKEEEGSRIPRIAIASRTGRLSVELVGAGARKGRYRQT